MHSGRPSLWTRRSLTEQFQKKTLETRAKNNIVSEIDSRFGPLITIILAISFVMSFGVGRFLLPTKRSPSVRWSLSSVLDYGRLADDLSRRSCECDAARCRILRRINEVLQTGMN